MTTADLEQAIEEHAEASADELADDIYAVVKAALENGADRNQVYATLRQYYDLTKERGLRRERRAIGDVLAYLDGYCSPVAAL